MFLKSYYQGDVTLSTKGISSVYKPTKGMFKVPDYYRRFSCKGSSCRNTCCSGWQVIIPMKEYFLLHGLECKKSMRERIDNSFKPLVSRTENRYAEIVFDYTGHCKMLTKEGYCSLHQTFGETVLPSVCRYFPRGPRIDFAWECSTSNGCEKTLELLFETDSPITFETMELGFSMPLAQRKVSSTDLEIYQSLRDTCIRILANRKFPLVKRVLSFGTLFQNMDQDPSIDPSSILFSAIPENIDIESSYNVARDLGRWFIENTGSLGEFFSQVEEMYQEVDIHSLYSIHKKHFEEILPNHEILLEKTLINNIFFRQFPFQDYTDNFMDEFIALCGKYFVIRYLSVNLMSNKDSLEDYIDIITRIFRTIAHTGFEKNIMILFKQLGFSDPDSLSKLIQI